MAQLTVKERETIEKVKMHYKSVLEDCDKALRGELPFNALQERITKMAVNYGGGMFGIAK